MIVFSISSSPHSYNCLQLIPQPMSYRNASFYANMMTELRRRRNLVDKACEAANMPRELDLGTHGENVFKGVGHFFVDDMYKVLFGFIPKVGCTTWIDHMHMTSQKGAQLRWGSNETLPRASSPSMQPGGQTLQATPPGWPARARALRGYRLSANAHCQHNTTRLASLLWRCDPL